MESGRLPNCKKMKRFFILFLTLASLALSFGFWRLSDGFSLSKISDPLPFDSRWEVESPPSFQIRSILSQPFTYKGKGSQSYVFESEDGKYVLKFFRLNRYRLPTFQANLPLPPFLAAIQDKRIQEKQEKKEKLFNSCKLAYEELREEAGLIYLHLNKTTHLTQEVILHDALKRPKKIRIDHFAFVIQRKAEQLYPYLNQLIHEGDWLGFKKALFSLSLLIDHREEKGIADGDVEIHKNTGFYQGRAMILDIGQFEKKWIAEDRRNIFRKLLLWIKGKEGENNHDIMREAQVILS